MQNELLFTVPQEYHEERIDKFVAFACELNVSRSAVQRLIKESAVLVNGGGVKPNFKLNADDIVSVALPSPTSSEPEAQNIPLDIEYEDDDIIVVNKQAGIAVHPGHGNADGTLVNGLLFHCPQIANVGEPERPGIVHRLDKDTAGLLVAAKTNDAHAALSQAFAERQVEKVYTAVVSGKPKTESFAITSSIARHKKYRQKMTIDPAGREALTECSLTQTLSGETGVFSLLNVKILTGRTHQIRVHLSSVGLPVVGDPIYSKRWERHNVPFLLLASVKLGFAHPVTGEPLTFTATLPDHIAEFIGRF